MQLKLVLKNIMVVVGQDGKLNYPGQYFLTRSLFFAYLMIEPTLKEDEQSTQRPFISQL